MANNPQNPFCSTKENIKKKTNKEDLERENKMCLRNI